MIYNNDTEDNNVKHLSLCGLLHWGLHIISVKHAWILSTYLKQIFPIFSAQSLTNDRKRRPRYSTTQGKVQTKLPVSPTPNQYPQLQILQPTHPDQFCTPTTNSTVWLLFPSSTDPLKLHPIGDSQELIMQSVLISPKAVEQLQANCIPGHCTSCWLELPWTRQLNWPIQQ